MAIGYWAGTVRIVGESFSHAGWRSLAAHKGVDGLTPNESRRSNVRRAGQLHGGRKDFARLGDPLEGEFAA